MNEQSMNFQTVLQALNNEQREVAENIYGPHLVVAGPGTGKTQVIGARILNMLLSESQIDPSNILCLTFTDAGAISMRKRLVSFIGPTAYKVAIHTFHSFCNDVVMNNLHLFGLTDLEPISDIERIYILHEIIDELPINHPLKRLKGDIYFEATRMSNLFSMMKEEGWSVDDILSSIKKYKDEMPTMKEFIYQKANKAKDIVAGDLKRDAIKDEYEKLLLTESAARLYPTYQEKMKDMGRYDFNDMIQWVLEIFDKTSLIRYYQEKYQFILVDEFQDTNGVQLKLLHKLISFWELSPDILVVADEDQAIYEFIGARLKNIAEFMMKYEPDVTVLLANYRSTQKILDYSRNVIVNNNERLDFEKNLRSMVNYDMDLDPIVINYPSPEVESYSVAKAIITMHDRGVAYKDIAVIYRKHRQGELLLKYLQNKGIPVNIKRRVNILEESILVYQIINILDYLSKITTPQREIYIPMEWEIMTYNYFGIEHRDIALYLQNIRKSKPYVRASIRGFRDKMMKLSMDVVSMRFLNALEYVIDSCGILDYIESRPERYQLSLELQTLLRFAREEAQKRPNIRISDFVLTVNKMITEGISLPVADINFIEDGVNMLTAHGAKGLEFDYVFLLGCNRSEWEKSRGVHQSFKIPPTLMYSSEEDKIESNRRLFYVSMTRAKVGLTVSYYSNNNGKEAEPSQFIEESKIPVVKFQNEDIQMEEFMLTLGKPTAFIQEVEQNIFEAFKENFRLSVSGMNTYLECQRRFYYEYVVKFPSPSTPEMIYGNAIHHAMKIIYDEVKPEVMREGYVPLPFTHFGQYMRKNLHLLTDQQFDNLVALGADVLREFMETVWPVDGKITLNEYALRNITIDGVPVTIIFDKISFNGHQGIIGDYKTGSWSNVKDGLKGPTEKDPYGGKVLRQFAFYQLGFNAIHWKPWQYAGSRVYLMDRGNVQIIPVEMDYDYVRLIERTIKDVYNDIMSGNFHEGCGECKWCKLRRS